MHQPDAFGWAPFMGCLCEGIENEPAWGDPAQHVAQHDDVAVGQPRHQAFEQHPALVGGRELIGGQHGLDRLSVLPVGLPDFRARIEDLADRLVPVAPMRLAPAFRQRPDRLQNLRPVLAGLRPNGNVSQDRQRDLAHRADLLRDFVGGCPAGFLDRHAEQHRRRQPLAGWRNPVLLEEVAAEPQRIAMPPGAASRRWHRR
jgi:hypothetical protein